MEISFALGDGDHFTSFRGLVAKRVRAAPLGLRRGQGIGKEGPEAVGVDIVQFDEPTFNVLFDEANDRGVAALERAAEGVKAETAVHICSGYGIKANTDWKTTLGAEWRQYEKTFPTLRKSRIDIVSLECRTSRVPMDLIELIQGKEVMVGVIDVATDAIETPEEVAGTLRKTLRFWMRTGSSPRRTAGWRRCRATWPRASWRPWARVPPSARTSRPEANGRFQAPALDPPARNQPERATCPVGKTLCPLQG